MIKVLKVLTIILLFMSFLFFKAYLLGMMLENKLWLLIVVVILGLIIALTVYFTALFMERIELLEGRIRRITKRKK